MTIAQSIKMNADQYLQMGEDPAGIRLELVDGEIQRSPSPTTPHAYAVAQLLRILGNYVAAHQLGIVMCDTDHVLSSTKVRRPDLYYFSTARVHLIGEDAIRHPPDLAVEIISPDSENVERVDKFGEYQTFGINHYWLIDPRGRTAEAFRLRRKKYISVGTGRARQEVQFPPFEELTLPLKELWWPPG